MIQTVRYGEETIAYRIRFLSRTARKLAIHVHPDGAVQVDAPEGTEPRRIKASVQARARWVSKQLADIRERTRHVPPREYVSGETHYYQGRRYVLKVAVQPDERPSVRLVGGQLRTTVPVRNADTVRNHMEAWYRERAKEVFARRLEALASRISWLRRTPPFRLLCMRVQWGSCSPKGTIILNPYLVKAPTQCIDYVIVHELCHLREHNHSARYYRLLGAAMPGWERRKLRLDQLARVLIQDNTATSIGVKYRGSAR